MSNNKIVVAWLGGLTVLFFIVLYLHFSTSQKVVYIDSNQLLNGYKGMQDARSAYQQKATVWQANVDTLMKEVQTAIMDYEKESQSMTAKEKELNKELIRTKQRQLQDYQAAMRDKSAQEDQQMTEKVLTTINAFMINYGKEHNYQVIFGATSAGNIIYADQAINITDEVLNLLNEQYQKM
ncbi:OmpH family outer membrane protein [Reichenbachiella carrageenanivorans]|uniref:OmpH family outer membrane protein n=1 Tax=Reichenbachiella carrageenanivorans TaxID=2979869 RepID=A0ABY6D3V2_9BACT|nr:OmpH family outer membrane protein [Reichenbachiella carrageenanivorans]UXX79788.1 OmpH family outer membrane protein [Reichenbachiella carrageenanivorans]